MLFVYVSMKVKVERQYRGNDLALCGRHWKYLHTCVLPVSHPYRFITNIFSRITYLF